MLLKRFAVKQFGYLDFIGNLFQELEDKSLSMFIKFVYIRGGGDIIIDFVNYQTTKDCLVLINPGQYFQFGNECKGTVLYYNLDFCSLEIHGREQISDQ